MINEGANNISVEKTGIPIPIYRIKKLSPESIEASKIEVLETKDFLFNTKPSADEILQKLNKDKERRYSPSKEDSLCASLISNIENPHLIEEDKVLISIAFWQCATLPKISRGRDVIKTGVARILTSQINPVSSNAILKGEKLFTCVDTACISLIMARSFSIDGSVEHYWHGDPKSLHHFFQAKNGRILDINSGIHAAGFFEDSEDHVINHSTKMNNKRHNTSERVKAVF